MNGRCEMHDEIFGQLYKKVESMDDKLDHISESLRDRIRDVDVRFAQIDMRLARVEDNLKTSTSSRIDTKRKLTGSAIDLIKMAIVGICGAALWAVANGYGG